MKKSSDSSNFPVHSLFQVDAFTDSAFKGNPAGVFLSKNSITKEKMQQIAMEMNLSETAFVTPRDEEFRIRYFTPKVEIDLCGHATLASAHILYEKGIVPNEKEITFQANKSPLIIQKKGDWIQMNFPVYSIASHPIHKNFKSIFGFEPLEMYESQGDWLIAIAQDEQEIINCKPKFHQMVGNGFDHIMITAISKSKNRDFLVRCFAPDVGIDEDPVTGSAHCALGPLWSKKLDKKELISFQCSERSGTIKMKMEGNRIILSGKAITIFEAKLNILHPV